MGATGAFASLPTRSRPWAAPTEHRNITLFAGARDVRDRHRKSALPVSKTRVPVSDSAGPPRPGHIAEPRQRDGQVNNLRLMRG